MRRLALAILLLSAPWACAQSVDGPVNPVFPDDSTLAQETLARLPELLAGGNTPEAARALQRLLEEEGDRVIATPEDPDLFVSVRSRVHESLLANPALLSRYRELESPVARAMLERDPARVERTRLLTPEGFEACLRLAQTELDGAHFESARLLLEQLDGHPDFTGPAAIDAARLMRDIAQYLPREPVIERARTWADRAGAPWAPPNPVAWPAGEPEPSGMFSAALDLDVQELLAKPLHSVRLSGGSARPIDRRGLSTEGPASLTDVPLMRGDVIFVGDGLSFAAWDRYTLSPRWRIRPQSPPPPRDLSQLNRDRGLWGELAIVRGITVSGSLLFGATGRNSLSGQLGDPRMHAIWHERGEFAWSWAPTALGPGYHAFVPTGLPLVHEDTLVFSIEKQMHDERVWALQIVGLDAASGRVRWARPIAAVGALPYDPRTGDFRASVPALHEGIVYRAEAMGVIVAIEAATGRVEWLRRVPATAVAPPESIPPTGMAGPVMWKDAMYVISSDASRIIELDRTSGAIRAERPAANMGWPRYLLLVGDTLVGVGARYASALPAAELADARVSISDAYEGSSVTGRALVTRGGFVLPTESGFIRFELDGEPGLGIRSTAHRLENSGVLISVEGQILALDGERMHSYLVWPVAEGVLHARMEARPDDAEPAIVFAELASQAGRAERIPEAARAAARILKESETPDPRLHARLVLSLTRMLERSQHPDAPERDLLPGQIAGELIAVLTDIALAPEERAAATLIAGRELERRGDIPGALTLYQSLLADAALRDAPWSGPDLSTRAELEAARRVRAAVLNAPGAYEPFDREAAMLPPSTDPVEISGRARRYPASRLAPRWWLEVAAHTPPEEAEEAIRALRAGLDTLAALDRKADEPAGELAGRLVRLLAAQGRLNEASRVLADHLAEAPALPLTDGGVLVDAGGLLRELAAREEARRRRPVLGLTFGTPQTFEGWRPALAQNDHAAQWLLLERDSEVEGLTLARQNATPGLGLELRWRRQLPRGTQVLAADDQAIFIAQPDGASLRLQRLDPGTGETLWTSPGLEGLLGTLPGAARVGNSPVETPMDGRVPERQFLLTRDERTLALVQRVGLALAIDLATGRVLWTSDLDMPRVNDAAAGSGILAAGGVGTAQSGELVVLDLRTGQPLFRASSREGTLPGPVRWVRLGERGEVLAGADEGVLCAGIHDARVIWARTDDALRATLDAWVIGEALLVLDAQRRLRLGHVASGLFELDPLDTGSLLASTSRLAVHALGDAFAVVSGSGLALFSSSGKRLAADALAAENTLFPPVPIQGGFVTLLRPETPGAGAMLLRLDATARLVPPTTLLRLHADPRRLIVLDQVLLIETDAGVVALPAVSTR